MSKNTTNTCLHRGKAQKLLYEQFSLRFLVFLSLLLVFAVFKRLFLYIYLRYYYYLSAYFKFDFFYIFTLILDEVLVILFYFLSFLFV